MNEPNLNVIVEDGRVGLEKSPQQLPDHQRGCLPPALHPLAHDHAGVFPDCPRPPHRRWRAGDQRRSRAQTTAGWSNAIGATIGAVFPSVYVMDIPDTFNSIIYATVQPTEHCQPGCQPGLSEQPRRIPIRSCLKRSRRRSPTFSPRRSGGQVFTDDLAPIEWITNSMIVNFFLSGEVEKLQ